MKSKMLMKIALVAPFAGLLMGNTKGCEQKQAASPRELRKIIQMGQIASPPLNFPGASFDFQFVANQQIAGVLMESSGFAVKSKPVALSSDMMLSRSNLGQFRLTSADLSQLSSEEPDVVAQKGFIISKEAACMVNMPMAKVAGAINSFEMRGSSGLSLGFTPGGAIPTTGFGGSLDFSIQTLQMDVSMRAAHPITGNSMAAVNVTSDQTKTNVNFKLTFGMFSLGPSYYYQIPLSTVTKTGLEKAVSGLSKAMATREWYSRVIEERDSKVYMVGGQDLNMKLGDEYVIFNEEYIWDGEPCAVGSTYQGGGASEPVAIVSLDWVGDEVSRGTVTMLTDENIRAGSKVRLFKRLEDLEARKDIDISRLVPAR